MKLNIQSLWMPRWVSGYTTREILLLEFSSSIMCLILAGKVGSKMHIVSFTPCVFVNDLQELGLQ